MKVARPILAVVITTLLCLAATAWASRLGVASGTRQEAGAQSQAGGVPTFYRDVLPILQTHCQGCHREGGIAPMAFESYEETRAFAGVIRNSTEKKTMPPWFADPGVGHFSNDPSLSAKEIATLAAWVEAKAPRGNKQDAPAPAHWAESWTISQPDAVVKMPRPVMLPASGDIEYTYEIVPTHFTEDRWVRAAEVLPALRTNVHHAVLYVRPPDSHWLRHAPIGAPFTASTLTDPEDQRDAMWTDSDILLVYAPGSSPDQWPETMAKLIPAGSDLVFQMHYTANGHEGADQTSVGLIFAKKPPPQRILTLQLTNDHFLIPPGVPDYRVEARGTLPNDALLLGFFPHMHLRGKKFEYNIIHDEAGDERSAGAAKDNGTEGKTDGRTERTIEPLLRVNYHFHWQMSYRLAEPRLLKAGTELQAVAWYDNSKSNPHNPDPEAAVRWGEQTYDEMMVGFFDVAVPAGVDKPQFFVRQPRQR